MSELRTPTPMQLLLISLACLTLGCDAGGEGLEATIGAAKPIDTDLTVNVLRIKREKSPIDTAIFFGVLEPNRQSRLGFQKGGTLNRISKQVGDSVKQGEVLAELDQAQLENQRSSLEQSVASAKQRLESSPQNVRASVQQEIQELQSQLQEIQLQLAKGKIVAPYDAIVSNSNVDLGELVSPQTLILEVVEATPILVAASMPTEIVDRLNSEQLVWIAVGNKSVQAKVVTKSPVESATGSKQVSLQLVEPEQVDWSFGQTVKIRCILSSDNSGFWVPISALHRQPAGLWSLLTLARSAPDNRADPRDKRTVLRKTVEIVELEDEWALVEGALQDDEMAIASGAHRVVPGQRVIANDITDQLAKPGSVVPE